MAGDDDRSAMIQMCQGKAFGAWSDSRLESGQGRLYIGQRAKNKSRHIPNFSQATKFDAAHPGHALFQLPRSRRDQARVSPPALTSHNQCRRQLLACRFCRSRERRIAQPARRAILAARYSRTQQQTPHRHEDVHSTKTMTRAYTPNQLKPSHLNLHNLQELTSHSSSRSRIFLTRLPARKN
jgi:hypothetical protein